MDYFEDVFDTFLGLDHVHFSGSQVGQSQASRFSSKIFEIMFRRQTKLLQVWNDMGVSD